MCCLIVVMSIRPQNISEAKNKPSGKIVMPGTTSRVFVQMHDVTVWKENNGRGSNNSSWKTPSKHQSWDPSFHPLNKTVFWVQLSQPSPAWPPHASPHPLSHYRYPSIPSTGYQIANGILRKTRCVYVAPTKQMSSRLGTLQRTLSRRVGEPGAKWGCK